MDIFDVLKLIGGLALFLYGMRMLGDGLKQASGGKLEHILEKLTSNKLMAVLLGAGVTALIQSSSATTVMVVGFVNSGIMKLSQAVGVILGANVGTTITAWILSLSAVSGSGIFLQLLKPSSFSPILAIIGVFTLSLAKKESRKTAGTILVGFAILMTGMTTMSGALEPLAESPSFAKVLVMFSNPILGMLIGIILTAIMQSSSASLGVLQALCSTGAVNFSTAIPITLGANVGQCITAMISSIGASKQAKRAALIHLYFNIIKTVGFLVIFYVLNAIVPMRFLGNTASATGVAIFHTTLNVVAVLVIFPVTGILEKLVYMTIPQEKEEEEFSGKPGDIHILDSRFLNTPSFALEQCKNAAIEMANYAKEGLFLSMELLEKYDLKKAQKVIDLEDLVDHYEDELGNYLVQLSSKKLSVRDSKELSELLHCIGDFERISDHSMNIKESADEMHEKGQEFSKKAQEELEIFAAAVKEIVTTSVEVFTSEDREKAKLVEPLEEVIDYLNSEIKKRHIRRLRKGKCTIELGFVLSDISTNFERVSDHCSNIALCLLQIYENNFETHELQETLSATDNEEFKMNVKKFSKKYQLPEKKEG